jgi:hypothetical protein
MQAEALIKHPCRFLFAGRAKSGKTTLAVKIIDEVLRKQIDRLIVLCPTWDQALFDPIRDLVMDKTDVIEDYDNDPFKGLLKQLRTIHAICKKKDIKTPNTLLLIDDMAGTKMLHGGAISPFGHISVQASHWNLSIFVLTQKAKAITPSFRDNLEYLVAFPLNKTDDQEWLFKEFNGNMVRKKVFMKLIKRSWKGFEDSGYGRHFLFIYFPSGSHLRYFSDFAYELTPKLNTKTTAMKKLKEIKGYESEE